MENHGLRRFYREGVQFAQARRKPRPLPPPLPNAIHLVTGMAPDGLQALPNHSGIWTGYLSETAHPARARNIRSTRARSSGVSTPGPGRAAATGTTMRPPYHSTRSCSSDSASSRGAGSAVT